MAKRLRRILIGTSGWNYKHWRGAFYPDNTAAKEWFDYYKGNFDTVEINNTFYNLPVPSVFRSWRRQAPAGFIYAIKANRYITHMKKLKGVEAPLRRFLLGVKRLGRNLGPILYQLPPSWKCNVERLERFLENLPEDKIHVFEFRGDSWFTKKVFEALDVHKASFCVHDMAGMSCPVEVTGKIAYLRFHGTAAKYRGGYPVPALKKWANWIRAQAEDRDVYAYFNNDAAGHAPRDAVKLKELLRPGK